MSQRIHLDATPGLFHQVLHCHQGDVGRQFEIAVVTRDGYEIPSGATFKIQATKPSGLGFTVTGTAANNIISFTSTEDMTSEAGEIPTQLEIKSGNDVIYTSNFLLVCETNVHPSSVTDGSPEEIISEITLLVERAETAASTAATDAANAAQARVDEMMDYLPTEVTNLKSELIYTYSCEAVSENTSIAKEGNTINNNTGWVASDYIDIGNHLDGAMMIFDVFLASWSGFAIYDADKTCIFGMNGVEAPNYGYRNGYLNTVKMAIPTGAKYIRISRYETDGYTAPSDIKVEWFKPKYSDEDIENIVKNTSLELDTSSVESISGKYIGVVGEDGVVNTNADFSITKPFTVPKGYTIELFGSGYSTNVAMMSSYLNGAYKVLVASSGSDYKKYTYTTNDNVDVVFSYATGNGYELKIYQSLEDVVLNTSKLAIDNDEAVAQLEAEVSAMSDKVGVNYATLLKNMAGIGDSLMSGEIYDDAHSTMADCYNYSWLALMSDLNKAQWECFSQGGLTTKSWLESHWKTDFESLSTLPDSIFIALGTNDRNNQSTIPTGSASDPSSANTFCGYYKRIIELAHAKCPNAKIYCCSLYSTLTSDYSALIESISAQYSYTYYIDIANNIDIDLSVTDVYAENWHFSTVGYLMVADAVFKLLNQSIKTNLIDYKYFGLYNNRA